MDTQPIVIDESDIFNREDLENEGIFIEHEDEEEETSMGDITTASVKQELFESGGVEILRDGKFVNIEDDFGLI